MQVLRAVLGIAVLFVAGGAGAVDTAVFKCEDKATAAVNKWGGARGKCLVKCQQAKVKGDAARVCSSTDIGFPDSVTAECIAKADAKYVGGVQAACPAGTIPSCGGYTDHAPNDATGYANAQIAAQASLIDGTTVPLLMCDPDPTLTAKCEAKVIGALAKLSAGVGKCLSKCYNALQLKGDASRQCTPDTTGDPFDTLDGETAACIDGAAGKASGSINGACAPLPACGLYLVGVQALLDLVTGNIGPEYADPASNPYCAP